MRLKKAVSVTLMAVMSLTLLAGCGSDGQQGSKEGGSDGAVFKIGGIGPATGSAAVYGEAVKNLGKNGFPKLFYIHNFLL